MSSDERFHTIVIGGGQAGLAAAYYLKQHGVNFVVLDSMARPGETWRKRWDSLRLFTPSKFDGLPGNPVPFPEFYFPTKNEIADYLEEYARKSGIPYRPQTTVESLSKVNGSYVLNAPPRRFLATNVVVATGAYQRPFIPSFAGELNPSIVQMHSSDYRNPGQMPDGTILVVGAANSGAEIALELAKTGREVWLSGREVGSIPANTLGRIMGGIPYWFFLSRVLSVHTPLGRNVRKKAIRQGTPYIRLTSKEIIDGGVTRCPRVRGVVQGSPQLTDGRILSVTGVVWATGFRPDFSWIQLPVFDEYGHPLHKRGVVSQAPGLFFLGLHFQTALSSALLGGVGRDARYVVDTLRARKNGKAHVGSPLLSEEKRT